MKSAHMIRWNLFLTLLSQVVMVCCFVYEGIAAGRASYNIAASGPSYKTSILLLTANAVIGEAKALQHLFIEDISAINNKRGAHSVKHLVVFG